MGGETMRQRRSTSFGFLVASALLVAAAFAATFAGCSNEREVLDVEAPGVDLEVHENTETGELNIDGELGEE
ncbi:MAG: hypothetical protein DWQ29_13470 [Planctomycetota bacterium]|nr:MAG: hypothetical protein DWQ29_13470 [Planctomycetota bacterium]